MLLFSTFSPSDAVYIWQFSAFGTLAADAKTPDGQAASTWALRGHLTAHFLPRMIWHGYQLNLGNLNHLHFNLHLREKPTFLLVTEQEILCCYTHDPLYLTKQLNNPFHHNFSSGSYSTSVGTLKQFTLVNSYSWLNCFEPKPFIVISTSRQYNSPVSFLSDTVRVHYRWIIKSILTFKKNFQVQWILQHRVCCSNYRTSQCHRLTQSIYFFTVLRQAIHIWAQQR